MQIDTIAPTTSIGAKPSNPSNVAAPTFGFSSSEPGSTFECSLDGGAYAACASPLTLPTLGEGPHTFHVRATDVAGNVDPSPAGWSWTIDTVPPAAGMNNPGSHLSGTVSLSSTSTDVGGTGVASTTFEYSAAGTRRVDADLVLVLEHEDRAPTRSPTASTTSTSLRSTTPATPRRRRRSRTSASTTRLRP